MRIDRQRSRLGVTQVSRHPEVNQESATGLEPNNQILAAAFQGTDAFALELCGHRSRLEWSDETMVVDLDSFEATPYEMRFQLEANCLHLGQLGHQAIVSSTIGVGAGASDPIRYAASTSATT